MRFTSNPHPARSWGVDDDGDERDFYSGQTAPAELKTGGSCLSPSRRDLYCPHCNSHRIVPSHLARRVGSAIGTIAGAATATTRVAGGAYLGAEFGALLGGRAGPAGFTLGTVAGALLGLLLRFPRGPKTKKLPSGSFHRAILKHYKRRVSVNCEFVAVVQLS